MNRKTAGWTLLLKWTQWDSTYFAPHNEKKKHDTTGARFAIYDGEVRAVFFTPFLSFILLKFGLSFVHVAMEAITKHDNYPLLICSKKLLLLLVNSALNCAWEDFSPFCATTCIPEEIIGKMCLINNPVS